MSYGTLPDFSRNFLRYSSLFAIMRRGIPQNLLYTRKADGAPVLRFLRTAVLL
jgi:hypothetical protein